MGWKLMKIAKETRSAKSRKGEDMPQVRSLVLMIFRSHLHLLSFATSTPPPLPERPLLA